MTNYHIFFELICFDIVLGVPEPDLKAPEQASAADMYSFGRVLFFCITRGRHPFDDTHDQLCEIIKKNKRNPSLVKNLPEAFDLISDLLNPYSKLRYDYSLN